MKKRYWIAFLSGLNLFSFVIVSWSCPFELPTVNATLKDHNLTLELATIPETRSCGLSNRVNLAWDRGMFFVYPEPKVLSFWMKNTSIPLSIAFIDVDYNIISIQKMSPFSIRSHYESPEPAIYALEVNQGWFEKNNIGIGDVLNIELPTHLKIY